MRQYASRPTYGSDTILKARPENGALTSGARGSSSSVLGLIPITGGTSSGEGR